MNTSCPHCGAEIRESQRMCVKCEALFHPALRSPAKPVSYSAEVVARNTPSPAVPPPESMSVKQSGLLLLGIGLVMFIVARVLGVAIGDIGGPAVRGILWSIICLAILVGIFGLVRLVMGVAQDDPVNNPRIIDKQGASDREQAKQRSLDTRLHK